MSVSLTNSFSSLTSAMIHPSSLPHHLCVSTLVATVPTRLPLAYLSISTYYRLLHLVSVASVLSTDIFHLLSLFIFTYFPVSPLSKGVMEKQLVKGLHRGDIYKQFESLMINLCEVTGQSL